MKIKEIIENQIIATKDNIDEGASIINHYVFLIDDKKTYVGDIYEIRKEEISIRLVGEIVNNVFTYGTSTKPNLNARIEFISPEQIPLIISYPDDVNGLYLGNSVVYENVPINININTFFSGHFLILGGTGSGKSFSLSTITQNLFLPKDYVPYNANIIIFDTYGEYAPSFDGIQTKNPYISVKKYTTNEKDTGELLKIPPNILGIDDLAILLNADTASQLQVLEKALDLVYTFKSNENAITAIKNNIIARAVLDIMLSGRPSVQIRDQVFSILSFYSTSDLSLDTQIVQPGYTRSLKNCLIIDTDGKIREMELITKFFEHYLIDEDSINIVKTPTFYTLEDLENAIDFALISEGVLKSEKIYDKNSLLKVRIRNLIDGDYKKYFECSSLITREEYVKSLITTNGRKNQIINFNISGVDDRFAKAIVKIISKILFDTTKHLEKRASMPFHIILEEAHRYVQKDNDVELLGYNIFERIAKEGRKYGVLLGLITQRPTELSETVISQCNNYLIFKMSHPKDMSYVKNLIPYLDEETCKKIQIMPPGNCYIFGSAMRLPMIIKLMQPNPTPLSNNVNILSTWFIDKNKQ